MIIHDYTISWWKSYWRWICLYKHTFYPDKSGMPLVNTRQLGKLAGFRPGTLEVRPKLGHQQRWKRNKRNNILPKNLENMLLLSEGLVFLIEIPVKCLRKLSTDDLLTISNNINNSSVLAEPPWSPVPCISLFDAMVFRAKTQRQKLLFWLRGRVFSKI